MAEPKFIKGKEFLKEIDGSIDQFEMNVIEEEYYGNLLKILEIDRILPDNKVPKFGSLVLDDSENEITNIVDGTKVRITTAQSQILWALIRRYPAYTSTKILGDFYVYVNSKDDLDHTTVKVLIHRINKALLRLTSGKYQITTSVGFGYILTEN